MRIAFVVPEINEDTRSQAAGICQVASPRNGFVVRDFVAPEHDPLQPALYAWQPHAIITYVANERLCEFDPMLAAGVPVVNTARGKPSERLAIVVADAQDLYDHVHRVFGALRVRQTWQVVFGEELGPFSTQARYLKYTKQRGIPFHSRWVADLFEDCAPYDFEEVDPAFASWLLSLRKPVGIFSQHIYAGFYIARCCELLGIHVPGEVAIIGTDSLHLANASNPPVTSIRAPTIEIGREAARLAIQMIEGAPAPDDIVVVQGMTMLARASTGSAPKADCDIDAALGYIDRYACDALKVNSLLSETQSVSRVTFHKHFVQATGVTPAQAIQQRRMGEARRLLTESQMSPSSIAGLCGYTDYMHFYRVFRKVEGVSPQQYRNLAK
jgi:AraC-like DNA-binding protein